MFDGLILMFTVWWSTNKWYKLPNTFKGNVFSCLFIVQLPYYPECLIISWVRLVMWDTWSITVDLRHGSKTATKRLGAGGPSRGDGPSPWPRHKAFGLRGDGGVLAWELRKSYGGGQINHFLRLKNNTQGICHAEFSNFCSSLANQGSRLWFEGSYMFPCFKLWTRLQQIKKIITFHQLAVFSDRMSTTVINRFNFLKDRCGIQLKVIKSSKSSEHLWPRAFHSCPPCLVISFTRISRGQSHHKSGSFNNKYHSTSQSKERKSSANVRTPSVISPQPLPNDPKTLPGPRPFQPAASTVAPAEISCSTTAAWPSSAAQCSAVRPRALRMWCGRSSSCGCRRETKRSKWDVSPGGWTKFWI